MRTPQEVLANLKGAREKLDKHYTRDTRGIVGHSVCALGALGWQIRGQATASVEHMEPELEAIREAGIEFPDKFGNASATAEMIRHWFKNRQSASMVVTVNDGLGKEAILALFDAAICKLEQKISPSLDGAGSELPQGPGGETAAASGTPSGSSPAGA